MALRGGAMQPDPTPPVAAIAVGTATFLDEGALAMMRLVGSWSDRRAALLPEGHLYAP